MLKEEYVNKLTAQQLMYCQYFAISNNSLQALRKAGYTNPYTTHKKFRNNKFIQQYISFLRSQMIEEYTVTYQYCAMKYKQMIEMAMQKKDYYNASNIVQKLSKLKEPVNNISGQVVIKIG